jgi:RHS repeat-associated protein
VCSLLALTTSGCNCGHSASTAAPIPATHYHGDHLGGTTLLTAQDGSVAAEIAYDPWGAEIVGATEPYAFTGKEYEPDTGLYDYAARVYDPVLARFLSPDPLAVFEPEKAIGEADQYGGRVSDPGTGFHDYGSRKAGPDLANPANFNRYSYVLNNPYKFVDPTGLTPEGAFKGAMIGGSVGGAVGFLLGGGGGVVVAAVTGGGGIVAVPVGAVEGGALGSGIGIAVGHYIGDLLSGSGDVKQSPGTSSTTSTVMEAKAQTPVTSGSSRAPQQGAADSIYEQRSSGGDVRSRTFYDQNGRPFSRQDFDHSHGGMQPHEHQRQFDANGKPVTSEQVRPVPPGYDTKPTVP